MPAHDPEVQHAANHAVSSIQQRSNSLLPYVLQEILNAKAEVSIFYFVQLVNYSHQDALNIVLLRLNCTSMLSLSCKQVV